MILFLILLAIGEEEEDERESQRPGYASAAWPKRR